MIAIVLRMASNEDILDELLEQQEEIAESTAADVIAVDAGEAQELLPMTPVSKVSADLPTSPSRGASGPRGKKSEMGEVLSALESLTMMMSKMLNNHNNEMQKVLPTMATPSSRSLVSDMSVKERELACKSVKFPETLFYGSAEDFDNAAVFSDEWRRILDLQSHLPASILIDKIAGRLRGEAKEWYRSCIVGRKRRGQAGWTSADNFLDDFNRNFDYTPSTRTSMKQLLEMDASKFGQYRLFLTAFHTLANLADIDWRTQGNLLMGHVQAANMVLYDNLLVTDEYNLVCASCGRIIVVVIVVLIIIAKATSIIIGIKECCISDARCIRCRVLLDLLKSSVPIKHTVLGM